MNGMSALIQGTAESSLAPPTMRGDSENTPSMNQEAASPDTLILNFQRLNFKKEMSGVHKPPSL